MFEFNCQGGWTFSIVSPEKEHPPAADCYDLTTLKRRQNFEDNIFTSLKKQQFLENLNLWQQNGDLAVELDKLTQRIVRSNGPGGTVRLLISI